MHHGCERRKREAPAGRCVVPARRLAPVSLALVLGVVACARGGEGPPAPPATAALPSGTARAAGPDGATGGAAASPAAPPSSVTGAVVGSGDGRRITGTDAAPAAPATLTPELRAALEDFGRRYLGYDYRTPRRSASKRCAPERIADPLVDIAPLYGAMERSAQDLAVSPAKPGRRKIVLATSIAETSLTIEGVRVVIDSGWRVCRVSSPTSG